MSSKKMWLLTAVIFVASSGCFGQRNAVYDAFLQRTARQESLEKAGIARDIAEWFATLGYTDKTIRDLLSSGIDIKKSMGDFYGRDEKIKTVLSDCIIIGTVSSIEHDSSEASRYHTIVHVAVKEYLRNDYRLKNKDLSIFVESGPMVGGIVEIYSHDVAFSIGERVLLFLDATSLMLSSRYNSPDYFQSLISSKSIQFRVAGLEGGKYLLSNGNAVCLGESKSLAEIRQSIESTMRILQKTKNIK